DTQVLTNARTTCDVGEGKMPVAAILQPAAQTAFHRQHSRISAGAVFGSSTGISGAACGPGSWRIPPNRIRKCCANPARDKGTTVMASSAAASAPGPRRSRQKLQNMKMRDSWWCDKLEQGWLITPGLNQSTEAGDWEGNPVVVETRALFDDYQKI